MGFHEHVSTILSWTKLHWKNTEVPWATQAWTVYAKDPRAVNKTFWGSDWNFPPENSCLEQQWAKYKNVGHWKRIHIQNENASRHTASVFDSFIQSQLHTHAQQINPHSLQLLKQNINTTKVFISIHHPDTQRTPPNHTHPSPFARYFSSSGQPFDCSIKVTNQPFDCSIKVTNQPFDCCIKVTNQLTLPQPSLSERQVPGNHSWVSQERHALFLTPSLPQPVQFLGWKWHKQAC